VPLIAASQRFSEQNPEVEFEWDKRSLQEFADAPVTNLAEQYDFLVIDHPWAGHAIQHEVFLPLERHLSTIFLQNLTEQSVGKSHESYYIDGHQCALAIDAATPVASFRRDLLKQLPDTWEELLRLAHTGTVIFPAISIDSLMNFYMVCSTLGEDPFLYNEVVVSEDIGIEALERLRALASLCKTEIFDMNPIKVYEAMSTQDAFSYCPFAYGYSNYSRLGYAKHLLTYTDMVTINGSRCRSTLGGTGLALSAKCENVAEAIAFMNYVASATCQRTLYVESGGQPGHRAAWMDDEVNRRTNDYFKNTLPALDRAFLRPRYDGYLHFQDNAGDYVRSYMKDGGDTRSVLEELNKLYRESKQVFN
jgi:multiple sugar transport system substrate-binding protein